MNTYKVINIFEQDFGCEGLPEGKEYSVDVILENCETKETFTVSAPDAQLYEKDINIGDLVTYNGYTINKKAGAV